jgi:hypothetical protein
VHEKKVVTCIVLDICWTLLAVPAEKLTEFPVSDIFKT